MPLPPRPNPTKPTSTHDAEVSQHSEHSASSSKRAYQRYRRIKLTAAASGLSRLVSFGIGLVSVPLLVKYLGTEQYALWATIGSTMAFLGFADMGISNGLLNAISESDGADDPDKAATYASTGFFLLLAMSVMIGVIFTVIYPYVPWPRVFNVGTRAAISGSGPATAALVACFLIYLPLTVAQRIQLGYQRGYLNQCWEAAGNIFALAALVCAIHWDMGLVVVVMALSGGPALSGLLNALTLFGVQRPALRPKFSKVSYPAGRRLITLGFFFVIIQLATAAAYQTDNLILAQVLGASAVTGYSIPLKLFGFMPAIISLLLTPLWPAYSEAVARGDLMWVRKTLRYSVASVAAVSLVSSLALALAAPTIIRIWVGEALVPSVGLLVGMALWAALGSISGALGIFLNGAGFIRVQAICSVLMATVNVALSVFLTRHIGVPGVIYGTVISHTIFILIPYCYFLPGQLAFLGSGKRYEFG